jgi:hypothetical protein
MIHEEPLPAGPARRNPWPFLLAGLAAATLAVPLTLLDHRQNDESGSIHNLLLGARIALLLAGLLATGIAVTRQARSAVVLGLAALVVFTASHALEESWDTIGTLFRVATVVALFAGLVVLLPQGGRRAVVSLLVVFHFGGIFTAVSNVPAPGSQSPWLVSQLWSRVYRPYLQFMYLTNAYHFYAPDPGPPCFLWFHVEYADGTSRWVKSPDRDEHATDPFALRFYRRLPITESTNQLLPPMAVPNDVAVRRVAASQRDGIPSPNAIAMPMPNVFQYRVPTDYSKRLLQSYARHAAVAFPHEDGKTEVSGVKIYRVVHAILSPSDFVDGASVLDPTLYWPYFQGEFDHDGNLKDPKDPYLYWLIPILKIATSDGVAPSGASPAELHQEVYDYVAVHTAMRP